MTDMKGGGAYTVPLVRLLPLLFGALRKISGFLSLYSGTLDEADPLRGLYIAWRQWS